METSGDFNLRTRRIKCYASRHFCRKINEWVDLYFPLRDFSMAPAVLLLTSSYTVFADRMYSILPSSNPAHPLNVFVLKHHSSILSHHMSKDHSWTDCHQNMPDASINQVIWMQYYLKLVYRKQLGSVQRLYCENPQGGETDVDTGRVQEKESTMDTPDDVITSWFAH